MRRGLAALLLSLAVWLQPAAATERIRHFRSDVTVARDGAIAVTETIRIVAEGDSIKRGILRDIPTISRDRRGRKVQAGFQDIAVSRDGRPERWETERIGNGTRIRIGDPDVTLSVGTHEYVIRYTMTGQVGFFDGFDELYWNATGTDWTFPIDVAEASVTLPAPAQFQERAAYTGTRGSKARNAKVVAERPGEIVFRTTLPLGVGEGLTVAAAWPKGIVAAPVSPSAMTMWLDEYVPPTVAALGLLGLLAFYFHAWRRAGRGPRPGTVVPIFSPPDDMSAAALRYVSEMGFDDRAFAAAIVDCGVRGHLRLVEGEKGFLTRAKTTIEKTSGAAPLPAPEAAMTTRLFADGDTLLVDDKHHETFSESQDALKKELVTAYKGKMFLENWEWSLGGFILLLAQTSLVGAALLAFDPSAGPYALAAPVAALIAFELSGLVYLRSRKSRPTLGLIFAVILGLAGVAAFAITVALVLAGGRVLPFLVPLLALPVAISAFWWMAAPTKAGRAMMDRIAGFRQYLSITEEARLETLHPPEKTPALFERYLPHAIALKVENQWADRFAGVLAAAARAGQTTGMGWYSGHGDLWSAPSDFVDQIGSSLTASVSSASTAPGSSGGGSSGGGGGGGGGSGW